VNISRRDVIRGGIALPYLIGSEAAQAAIGTSRRFHRGINAWPWLSLTKEFPAPRTDYAWPPFQEQRPIPTRRDLQRLRAAGFDFVRIPVDPGPFLSFTGGQRKKLLASLFDAIDEAVSVDLSVIVDIHPNESTHYWISKRMIGSREAPAFSAYLGLVDAIANGMKRFDAARVALEPVNEPPQSCDSSAWNAVQLALLNQARSAAPELILVATGACGSMIPGLEHIGAIPLLSLRPILFSFHFYEPYLFSHQGAPWMREPIYRWLNNVPWPASAGSLELTLDSVNRMMAQDDSLPAQDKLIVFTEIKRVLVEYFAAQPDRSFLERYLGRVQNWATLNHVQPEQILMGEFGALRSDNRYTAAKTADRARYVRDVREAAEAYNFSWAFWNLFDGMGLMDDSTKALDPAIIHSLGLNMPQE
jgi:Cellulase (glycosyl hydrolase family 5)